MTDREREPRMSAKQRTAYLDILREFEADKMARSWTQLHSRGHHYGQVSACVTRGFLDRIGAYFYRITDAGRALLTRAEQE